MTLASGDLVTSGARYDGCFNLTIYGNRYRSFVRNQNDNPHVDIEKAKARAFVIRIRLNEKLLAQFAVSGLYEQSDGKRVVLMRILAYMEHNLSLKWYRQT